FANWTVLIRRPERVPVSRTALECTPPHHPDPPKSLVNLANCLHERFQGQAIVGDLAEAIELSCAALVLLTLGHADRASTLGQVKNS
ncbi:hypothetical protein EDD17DRAFT_1416621, partial [Pisolithus thermaeus]